jgi:hypothetical protein
MTPEQALYLLTHPEEWPHGSQLPVIRRGGKPVWNRMDCGIVLENNFCRVWIDVHLGVGDPKDGIPRDYPSPEALLAEWEID